MFWWERWLRARLLIVAMVAICTVAFATPVGAGERHVCEACGQSIEGPWFQTQDVYYHPYHFTCAYCDQAITDETYTTHRGKNYHEFCFSEHVALRCSVCDEALRGSYLIDFWGNLYHAYHQDDALVCDFCNRLITEDLYDGGTEYSDGRHLCRLCNASAITDESEAMALARKVAGDLTRFGIDVRGVDLGLHLVGGNELQRLSGKDIHGMTGFTDYRESKNIFGRTHKRHIDIYLLRGMPRIEMEGTIAHELTHVWQFVQGRLHHDRALAEGSCNFAAYLLLRKVPGDEARYVIHGMLEDEDEIYGEGFRRVKRYAESHGISGWLTLLREKNPVLPR